jgi:hypothetical protein
VTVTPATGSLAVGGSSQLTAAVAGTANAAVQWTSSAPGVATVSSTGVVTGVSAGSATVTATSVADPTKAGRVTVQVTPGTTASAGQVGLAPSSFSAYQYSLNNHTIAVTRPAGFTGDVILKVDPPPAGFTASIQLKGLIVPSRTTENLRVQVGPQVPTGAYTLVVRATGARLTETTTRVTVNVVQSVYTGRFDNVRFRTFQITTGDRCEFDVTLSGTVTLTYPSMVRGTPATVRVAGTQMGRAVAAKVGRTNCTAGESSHTYSAVVQPAFGSNTAPAIAPTTLGTGANTYTFASDVPVFEAAPISNGLEGTLIRSTLTIVRRVDATTGLVGSTNPVRSGPIEMRRPSLAP